MNKYCTSLELSKQLYEKNIIEDAEHWWKKVVDKIYHTKYNGTHSTLPDEQTIQQTTERYVLTENKLHSYYPAPIAEELLALLPAEIEMFLPKDNPEGKIDTQVSQNNLRSLCLTMEKIKDSYEKYTVDYCYHGRNIRYYSLQLIIDYSLSNALAKMLLWLHKEGYLND